MTDIKVLIKALIISIAIALTFSFSNLILFSTGVSYDPTINWQEVESMSHADATAYIESHSKKSTKWEIVATSIEFKSFLEPSFFLSIMASFVYLLLFNIWVKNGRTT